MKVLADPVCEVDPNPYYERDDFGGRVRVKIYHVSRGHDEVGYREAYGLAGPCPGGLRLATTLPCTRRRGVVR